MKATLKTFFIIGFILLSLLIDSHGQTIIEGRVYNKKNNQNLVGANIFLENTSFGASTDTSGKFIITVNGLETGHYTLHVNYMGFHDHERKLLIRQGDKLSLKLPLKESFLYMDQIVVTGTKTERILKDSPVTTMVIKGEKISESGASDVSELLGEVTGITIDESARFGSSVDLQGFDSNHILFMVDGMQLIGRLNGQMDISQIPISRIERIEVVKGATSSLYGSQAMGGVVNIITKKSTKNLDITSDIKTGSYNRYDGNISLGLPVGNWAANLVLGTRRFGGFDLDESTEVQEGRSFIKYDAGLNINGKLSRNSTLSFQGSWFDEEQKRVLNAFFEEKTQNKRTAFKLQTDVDSLWTMFFRASVDYSRYNHSYSEVVRSSGYIKNSDPTKDELLRGELLLSKKIFPHNIDFGYSYEIEKIESIRIEQQQKKSQLHNLFMQDEYKPVNWLSILAGGRYDMHSIYGNQFSPKISLMLVPKSNRRLRVSYGHGFRAPSFKELYLKLYVGDVNLWVLGNPDLKPENSKAFNIDYEVWNSRNYHVRANLFYNRISDLIDDIRIPSDDGSLNYTYINFASAQTWGGECDLHYFPGDMVELSFGYSYLDSYEETSGKPLSGKAKHRGQAGAIISLPYNIKFNIRAVYTGEKTDRLIDDESGQVSEEIPIEDYFIYNLNISAALPLGLRIYGGGRNLSDYVNKTWGPMPGREWYLGLSYSY